MKFVQLIPQMGKIIGLDEDGQIYYGKYMSVDGKDEIHWILVPSIDISKEV